MFGLAADGPVVKARETLRVFMRQRPSLAELWASREGEFHRALPILPSVVAADEPADLTVQAWDEYERLHPFEGSFRVETTDPDAQVPGELSFPPDNGGVVSHEGLRFRTPGVQYLTLVDDETGERWTSNPVRVTDGEPDRRVYWGDIHLHSQLSDGTGSVAKGMRYGRDVMALDVVSYTDHDTMGFFIPPSLQRRRMHRRYFQRLKDVTAAFHDPGEFVTLMAYEWTKQPNRGGHVNVYFDGVADAHLYDSLAEESDSYEKLFERLREYNAEGGTQAVSVPHHPAESMYPFDFAGTDYDDEVAPLVEVYSQWGSSERPGSDGNQFPLEMGQGEVDREGYYVQDALRLGYQVGMTASADYHGPHPGHSLIHAPPHLPSLREWREDGVGWGNIWRVWNEQSYPGGLCAFYAPELTREAVFESLRRRSVYGTTQPHRILARFTVDDTSVGDRESTVTLGSPDEERRIGVEVAGTDPLASVVVVKNNEPWRRYEGTDDPGAPLDAYTFEGEWTDAAPVEGMSWGDGRGTDADVYYLRVRQTPPRHAPDHEPGMAWVGPLWVDVETEA